MSDGDIRVEREIYEAYHANLLRQMESDLMKRVLATAKAQMDAWAALPRHEKIKRRVLAKLRSIREKAGEIVAGREFHSDDVD